MNLTVLTSRDRAAVRDVMAAIERRRVRRQRRRKLRALLPRLG